MKIPCEKCGKPIDTKGMPNHLKACKGTLQDETPKQEQDIETTGQEEQQDQFAPRPEHPAQVRLNWLASFLRNNFASETGMGDFDPVECAIRLLKQQLEAKPVSLPLNICPPELAIMDPRKQIYLDVAGHVNSERFIVELVKLRR